MDWCIGLPPASTFMLAQVSDSAVVSEFWELKRTERGIGGQSFPGVPAGYWLALAGAGRMLDARSGRPV